MADNPTRVGPERRSGDIADVVLTTPSANEQLLEDAVNDILAVLRKAGFLL